MDNKHTLKPTDNSIPLYAILIITSFQCSKSESEVKFNELESLCKTAGISCVERKFFNIKSINPATYIGKGQAEELINLADLSKANLLIFNESISPRIQRNLEELTSLCTIDRQEVILQIFADQATTKEAKLQVELAQLQYSLPRLSRKWADFSQQRGGVKGSRGTGEKQIELDKRHVQERISKLKKEIDEVGRQRSIKRRNRSISYIPNVAIVGYTNSGKSTLLNRLSNAGVLSEDKLFATLDTTTRKVHLPSGRNILFTDTVGFVSDLPHELIDAFRSTLEEATIADFLLIVIDASSKDLSSHFKTTETVLKEIGACEIPYLVILNKMDKVNSLPENLKQEQLLNIMAFEASQPLVYKTSILSKDLTDLITLIDNNIKVNQVF